MNIIGETNIGLQRKENEDAFYIGNRLSDDVSWCMVCDGMGGANAGQVASKKAVSFISAFIEENYFENVDVKDLLNGAIIKANTEIFVDSKENKDREGMGTTVVIAFFVSNKVYIAHVGDSRAYLVDAKTISQITTDHSMVQALLDKGKISPAEAREHPQKNIITRALGVSVSVQVDFNEFELQQGEMVLLCSDGLSGLLEDTELLCLARETAFEALPKEFISAANERGGVDNITIVIAKL